MPQHIKDKAATRAVRRLAEGRKITLTDAVRIACEEAPGARREGPANRAIGCYS